MGIQNFPASLQAIIQQGFLEREFEHALTSRLGYRAIADREKFAVGIGETLTKTRAGLKPSVTHAGGRHRATRTSITAWCRAGWGVEQYTITLNHYAATTDLNMVTSRVGHCGDQFLQNAAINGEQASRSLDELARNCVVRHLISVGTPVCVLPLAFGRADRLRWTIFAGLPQRFHQRRFRTPSAGRRA